MTSTDGGDLARAGSSPSESSAGRVSRARRRRDLRARRIFFLITLLPLALVVVMGAVLAVRSWPIVQAYPLEDLIFGTTWRPDRGEFGLWPFIMGTVWVSTVGVVLAVPPCLLTAIYLSEYAHRRTRSMAKPVLDLLAAIPPIVYGVWGVLAIVPFVQAGLAPLADRWLAAIPILAVNQPTGFSILSGGIVLAVMIAPLMIAVTMEIFATVPEDLRHASLAVGATQWQTIRRVVIPQVMPGIVAAVVLGTSRAIGETIAVLMVVGNLPQVPGSVFDAGYPLPALIANNYGDMMSIPLYDSALLGVALILLVIILAFNLASTLVLQRFLRRRS